MYFSFSFFFYLVSQFAQTCSTAVAVIYVTFPLLCELHNLLHYLCLHLRTFGILGAKLNNTNVLFTCVDFFDKKYGIASNNRKGVINPHIVCMLCCPKDAAVSLTPFFMMGLEDGICLHIQRRDKFSYCEVLKIYSFI